MTDARLQQLQRAWEASGVIDDEVAYLRERARVGLLAPERLLLAACCGNEAAARLHQQPLAASLVAVCWTSQRVLRLALVELCLDLVPDWRLHPGPGPCPGDYMPEPPVAARVELSSAVDQAAAIPDLPDASFTCLLAAHLVLELDVGGTLNPALGEFARGSIDRFAPRLSARLANLGPALT